MIIAFNEVIEVKVLNDTSERFFEGTVIKTKNNNTFPIGKHSELWDKTFFQLRSGNKILKWDKTIIIGNQSTKRQ